jgi:hypothetical protein
MSEPHGSERLTGKSVRPERPPPPWLGDGGRSSKLLRDPRYLVAYPIAISDLTIVTPGRSGPSISVVTVPMPGSRPRTLTV